MSSKVICGSNKMVQQDVSIVEDQGQYSSSCGYCKSSGNTSISYGLWAHSLSVYDYEGMFLYKPEMEVSCCPPYTIRLKVNSFCPSNEQNRVIRRMQRYLDGTYDGPLSSTREDSSISDLENPTKVDDLVPNRPSEKLCCNVKSDHSPRGPDSVATSNDVDNITKKLCNAVQNALDSLYETGLLPRDLKISSIVVQKVHPAMRKRIKTSTAGRVGYSCNVAFSVAAMLSKHKEADTYIEALQQAVDYASKKQDTRNKVSPCLFAEVLASKLQGGARLYGYEVEACNGHLNFLIQDSDKLGIQDKESLYSSKRVDKEVLSSRMQGKCGSHIISRGIRSKRILEVRMKRSAFDPEEFALYKRYQIAVHHDRPDDVKESSYIRFLVNSPLKFVPPSGSETVFCGFGSFHQQYRIDGCLIAVGVVDILPSCLSSKYMFWEPDLAFLSLGKYTALKEIEWVQMAHAECPSLEYYYLGYYIHTCPKMRYKAAYRPSELLCPVTFQWVPFEIAEPLFDRQPYICLSNYVANAEQYTNNDTNKDTLVSFKDDNDFNDCISEKGTRTTQDASYLSGLASSSKETEDVGNTLLKLGEDFLQFKYLQGCIDERIIRGLVLQLREYSQRVGPTLATKMAYVLS
ncbi:hypothetical protein KP509_32G023400 [Ceratopteris richardii]|uniref:Arginyl-tRNA--protein transferase n=1 Tax=Ceratopteris richardii TaxID=49495 RepID=A0A8T2QS85_CERRI|nr:hypothetical protein KP509_32G023400 [Ceratopteris richardii]KAH7286807.1 hypothetical protein KP509_32G023400 [Ceratopteris richardii]KAH7286810.1 hypothetical protein KP509_32G023400 [Ceratopteris richardii]KAH7286812.1 hypothetical protein KP509_32G023400 [Ceratopteris richardii]